MDSAHSIDRLPASACPGSARFEVGFWVVLTLRQRRRQQHHRADGHRAATASTRCLGAGCLGVSSGVLMLALVPALVWFTRALPAALGQLAAAIALAPAGQRGVLADPRAGHGRPAHPGLPDAGRRLRLRLLAEGVVLRIPEGRPLLRQHGGDHRDLPLRAAAPGRARPACSTRPTTAPPVEPVDRPGTLPGAQAGPGIPGRRRPTSSGCRPRATTSTCASAGTTTRCAAPSPASSRSSTRAASRASTAATSSTSTTSHRSSRSTPATRACT